MRLLLIAILLQLPFLAFSQDEVVPELHITQSSITRFYYNHKYAYKMDTELPYHWRSFTFFNTISDLFPSESGRRGIISFMAESNDRVKAIKTPLVSLEQAYEMLDYVFQKKLYNYNFEKLSEFLETRFQDYAQLKPETHSIAQNLFFAYQVTKVFDLAFPNNTSFHYDAALTYLENLRAFNYVLKGVNITEADLLLMDLLESLRNYNFRRTIVRELVTSLVTKNGNDLDAILCAKFQDTLKGDSVVEKIIDILNDTTRITSFISPELSQLELLSARQIYILERMYRATPDLNSKKAIAKKILQITEKVYIFMDYLKSKYARRFKILKLKYSNELVLLEPISTEDKLRDEKIKINSEFRYLAASVRANTTQKLVFADSSIVFFTEYLEIRNQQKDKVLELFKPRVKTLKVASAYREISGEAAYTFNDFFSLVDMNKEIDGVYITEPYSKQLPLSYVQVEVSNGLYLLLKTASLVKNSITLEQIQNKTVLLARTNPLIPIKNMMTEATPVVIKPVETEQPLLTQRPKVYVIPESRFKSKFKTRNLKFCQDLFS